MTSNTINELSSFITTHGVDTLMISKILRQINFSEEQADIVSEIVKQTNLNAEQIVLEKISAHKEEFKKESDKLVTKSDVKELELKIERVKSDLIKWVIGLMIANTVLLFTLIKFFN